MKLNTLRYLDRKIGIPLCYAAYYFKRFLFLHSRHKFEKEKVKKILIIKIYGMGSIILASPVFQNLKKNFPEAEIWFLTKKGLDKIYPTKFFNHIEILDLNFLNAFSDFLRLVFKFRRENFDLVIDLEIVSRYTALLSYLSGAKTKVGFEIMGQNKDKLYDYKAVYHESRHMSKTFLNTVETLGVKTEHFEIEPPEFLNNDKEKIKKIFQEKNIFGDYAIVNINASELAFERRLPLNDFKIIIQNISDKNNLPVLLIGSKSEGRYVKNFIKNFLPENKKVFDLTELNLSELFALMRGARLVVSNDSGPAHAAASFDVPTIIFFGPSSPIEYAPIKEKTKIFYNETFCGPCISIYRDKKINCAFDQKCLKNFDINEINKTVDEFLK